MEKGELKKVIRFLYQLYCINSTETKEIMVHYILQPHHIFGCVKAFVFVLCSAPGNEHK